MQDILPAGVMFALAIAAGVVAAVVHLSFAFAVLGDASRLSKTRSTILVGPVIWFLTTLFGGLFVAVTYWVMHHSRLNAAVEFNANAEQRFTTVCPNGHMFYVTKTQAGGRVACPKCEIDTEIPELSELQKRSA